MKALRTLIVVVSIAVLVTLGLISSVEAGNGNGNGNGDTITYHHFLGNGRCQENTYGRPFPTRNPEWYEGPCPTQTPVVTETVLATVTASPTATETAIATATSTVPPMETEPAPTGTPVATETVIPTGTSPAPTLTPIASPPPVETEPAPTATPVATEDPTVIGEAYFCEIPQIEAEAGCSESCCDLLIQRLDRIIELLEAKEQDSSEGQLSYTFESFPYDRTSVQNTPDTENRDGMFWVMDFGQQVMRLGGAPIPFFAFVLLIPTVLTLGTFLIVLILLVFLLVFKLWESQLVAVQDSSRSQAISRTSALGSFQTPRDDERPYMGFGEPN